MSSSYASYELEKERQRRLREQLRNELRESADRLMARADASNASRSGGVYRAVVTGVSLSDDRAAGEWGDLTVSEDSAGLQRRAERTRTLESGLVRTAAPKADKWRTEAEKLYAIVEQSPDLTRRDREEKERVLEEMRRVFGDESADIEVRIDGMRMRAEAFAGSRPRLTAAEKKRLSHRRYLYAAMCGELSLTPVCAAPYEIEDEIARMTPILEKRREDAYAMDVIEECLEELGCQSVSDAVLDHTAGVLFDVEEAPLCRLFVGDDGTGLVFEPVAKENAGTSAAGVDRVCSLYAKLGELAAQKGVLLRPVYTMPPEGAAVSREEDVSGRREHRKKKRTAGKKADAME